jgi:hypothetical protein
MRSWQNVGATDRAIRVIGGLILLYLGIFTGVVIPDVFVVVGAVALITGAVGYCPLYAVLKVSTAKHPAPGHGHRAA